MATPNSFVVEASCRLVFFLVCAAYYFVARPKLTTANDFAGKIVAELSIIIGATFGIASDLLFTGHYFTLSLPTAALLVTAVLDFSALMRDERTSKADRDTDDNTMVSRLTEFALARYMIV